MLRVLPNGVTMSLQEVEPGGKVAWHDRGKARLCVVWRGALEVEDASGRRRREPGDLAFRPAPVPYRLTVAGRSVSLLTLELSLEAFATLRRPGFAAERPAFVSSRRALRLARLVPAHFRRLDAAGDLELLGLGYELLATLVGELSSPTAGPTPWIARTRDRLLAHLDRNPSLAELARLEEVSPMRLARRFRRELGVSVTGFVHNARLERAMALLADTALPLAQVALEAGFYDQSHLTNALKRRTGLTPLAYRRAAQQGAH